MQGRQTLQKKIDRVVPLVAEPTTANFITDTDTGLICYHGNRVAELQNNTLNIDFCQ